MIGGGVRMRDRFKGSLIARTGWPSRDVKEGAKREEMVGEMAENWVKGVKGKEEGEQEKV